MIKLVKKITTGLVAASFVMSGTALASDAAPSAVSAMDKKMERTYTPAEKQAIKKVVQEYLLENPEILIQMTQILQSKEVQKRQSQILTAIPDNAEKLFNDSFSPVLGAKEGSVTLVQFFDYQCGHCRRMEPALEALPGKHDNLRMIYKVFPIFGAESEFASRAALAAQLQGKFNEMHKALMTVQPPLSKKKVLAAAKTAGLDLKKLQNDIRDPKVDQELATNFELAKALGIQGTPSFIISNPNIPTTNEQQKGKEVVFLPGAVDMETLDKSIAQFK